MVKIPANKIPVIPCTKPMIILGENGRITINGIFLYNDELFKKGRVYMTIENNNVYLNGNRIAKDPGTIYVMLPNYRISHVNIKKFKMEINEGEYFVYEDNLTTYNSSRKYDY